MSSQHLVTASPLTPHPFPPSRPFPPRKNQDLQAEYHREAAARKEAEERSLAALSELERLRSERAEAQRLLAEREEVGKLRVEVDLGRAEVAQMEQEADDCIKARGSAGLPGSARFSTQGISR